ncbi:hypothetical protein RFI_31689, partial [Reticulomyxa filosa]
MAAEKYYYGCIFRYTPWLVLFISSILNIIFVSDIYGLSGGEPSRAVLATPRGRPDVTFHRKRRKVISNQSNYQCDLPESIKPMFYVYDIPSALREELRKEWYEIWYQDKYNAKKVNFGFGPQMKNASPKQNNKMTNMKKEYYEDYYYTHMHSMELFINERLKVEERFYKNEPMASDYSTNNLPKWVTNDPSQASVFIIPFPFALSYRVYRDGEWSLLQKHHATLQEWLDVCMHYYSFVCVCTYMCSIDEMKNNSVYKDNIGKKMHVILFGRIAYETGQITRRGSPFWNDTSYYVVSIDRNCHGDVQSCLTRLSMPHPSAFHPRHFDSLYQQISNSKAFSRDILVSFCGAVRTPTRNQARITCVNAKQSPILVKEFSGNLCWFDDTEQVVMRLQSDSKHNLGTDFN